MSRMSKVMIHDKDAIEAIARVCHEANVSLCKVLGDDTQGDWDNCPQWQRDSSIRGVEFALANPTASASAQHDAWLADKARDGWKWGAVKDAEKKEHPCFVPYDQLPNEQRIKDYLFRGVVHSFIASGLLDGFSGESHGHTA